MLPKSWRQLLRKKNRYEFNDRIRRSITKITRMNMPQNVNEKQKRKSIASVLLQRRNSNASRN